MDLQPLPGLISSALGLPHAAPPPPSASAGGPTPVPAFLCQSDPLPFWQNLLAEWPHRHAVAFADPHWPADWFHQLQDSLKNLSPPVLDGLAGPNSPRPRLLIPTSGSSGLPRFCIHDPQTVTAAARAFATSWAGHQPLHAVSFLPPYHIGGFMPVLRAAVQNHPSLQVSPRAKARYADYRQPASLAACPFPLARTCLSVVPTQLHRMLQQPEWIPLLQSVHAIFVGGAACPPDLRQRARRLRLPLALAYGATETAAMVSLSRPADFLAGADHCGKPLPHVSLHLDSDQRLLVQSPANLRQYWPPRDSFSRSPFLTSDVAWLDPEGRLSLRGRADQVLISGGKKIHPHTVEAAALQSGFLHDVAALTVPHPDWGQVLHLKVVPRDPAAFQAQSENLLAHLRQTLPAYALPKAILPVPEIPRHPVTGKRRLLS